ncbi:MAG TPA: VWA domain-containing protein [Vicinamibacterales bacterium]|nr:VWA domain-containing protein [Vicinamibacterales bacterium]
MRRGVGVLAVLLLATWPAAQTPEPTVRILEPVEDSYVSGEVAVRAAVEPRGTPVERVRFFADGRLICALDRPPFECPWNAGAIIREHDIRVVADLPGGRRAAATVATKGVGYAEAVDVDRIQVTAVVLDGNRFVQGLPRSAFRLFEDGVRVPIEHFGFEEVPLELAVGVDISESMIDAIDQTKEFVKRFLSRLRSTDRVSVLAFNENQFLIARPSVGLPARLAAVDALATWGATALHDVIIRSFETLGRQPGRRALVMFTDGEDTASRVSAPAVERRAEAGDAVLYMIGQGRAVESAALKSLCERLAARSGGRAFFPRRIEELGEVFDRIAEELSNQYLMTFAPSAGRDGGYHEIRLEVEGGYQVRARSGYRLETRGAQ